MKFSPPILSCSTENFYFHAEDYSFGFNGKELDKEGMGGGASTYDYGFRIYNSALAKFLSVDPLKKDYPWYTPYQFAGNMPIWAIDLDGLEEYVVISVFRGGKFRGTYISKIAKDDQIKGEFKKGQVLYMNVELDNNIDVHLTGKPTPGECKSEVCVSWKDYYTDYKAINSNTTLDGLGNREVAALSGFQDHEDRDKNQFKNGILLIAIPEPDPKKIQFEKDSDVLTVEAQKELDKLVSKLDYFEEMKISLFAHTSEEGTAEYNMDLSKRRAEAVQNYLLSKGVKSDNINAVEGKGESEPLEKGTDEENRRVEIKIDNRGYEKDDSPTSKAAHE